LLSMVFAGATAGKNATGAELAGCGMLEGRCGAVIAGSGWGLRCAPGARSIGWEGWTGARSIWVRLLLV